MANCIHRDPIVMKFLYPTPTFKHVFGEPAKRESEESPRLRQARCELGFESVPDYLDRKEGDCL